MTSEHKTLWDKVCDFQIDDPDSSFSFSDRLARENGWDLEYALRAVHEYKRFMFLICISETPLTPSDQVDQVWHLHLIYTQSYWKEFCAKILNQEIHHGPTKGVEQRGDFKDYYSHTLALYQKTFNDKAPEDIWPGLTDRFKSIHFERVNKHTHWVLPKLITKK